MNYFILTPNYMIRLRYLYFNDYDFLYSILLLNNSFIAIFAHLNYSQIIEHNNEVYYKPYTCYRFNHIRIPSNLQSWSLGKSYWLWVYGADNKYFVYIKKNIFFNTPIYCMFRRNII